MLNTKTIAIAHDILMLIAKIDEFKGAWQALGTLAPKKLLALRRVATIESQRSPDEAKRNLGGRGHEFRAFRFVPYVQPLIVPTLRRKGTMIV